MRKHNNFLRGLLALVLFFTLVSCEDVVVCDSKPFTVRVQFFDEEEELKDYEFDTVRVSGSNINLLLEDAEASAEYFIPLNPNEEKSSIHFITNEENDNGETVVKLDDFLEISYIVRDSIASPECGAVHLFKTLKLEDYTFTRADTVIFSQDEDDPDHNETFIKIYNYRN
ncbi:hypothetical protein [Xanthovirga aplysinae]|uniref:hypothetical protein n=1 Tax=Xanthovirga aplysinae TaxID=2529853 RepID=UPI0012BD1639|nr:hypothetical protein [Xanthovirga aplysinae]MTI30416.1 hypothetical protein [Xanthovirga aplysinae]